MDNEDRFELWETVKTFYKERFGLEPQLVDIAADYDTLAMCARGASNKSIGNFLGVTEDYDNTPIQDTIDRHLGFTGWEHDLPLNPKKVYDALDTKDLESFRNVIVVNYGYMEESIINSMYDTCIIVSKLERLLNESWI